MKFLKSDMIAKFFSLTSFLCLLLVCSVPYAATITGTSLKVDNTTSDYATELDSGVYKINISECEELFLDNPILVFKWEAEITDKTDARYSIKLQREDGSCSKDLEDGNEDGCVQLADPTSLTSTSTTIIYENKRFLDIMGDTNLTECDSKDLNSIIYLIVKEGEETEVYENPFTIRVNTMRPECPTDLEVEAGETTLSVTWTNPDNETDCDEMRVYYSVDEFSTATKPETLGSYEKISNGTCGESDTGEVTSGVSVDNTYYVSVSTIDEFGNPSLFCEVKTIQTSPVDDFFEVYKNRGGGEEGCFIATAAYGSYDHAQVIMLRQFRDKLLLTNAPGQLFTRIYYTLSPPLADFIANTPLLKQGVRIALIPFVLLASIALESPLRAGFFMILLGALALLFQKKVRPAQAKN